jgi:hypothetical membrane protein
VCIGLFSEDAGRIHYYFSVAFFVLLPLSMIALGLVMLARDKGIDRPHGALTLALSILGSLIWAVPHEGAIPEIISSVAGSIVILSLSLRLLVSVSER